MNTSSKTELESLIEVYDSPEQAISTLKKKTIGFLVIGLGCIGFSPLEDDGGIRAILLVIGGITLGLSIWFRSAYRQIPLLTKYTVLNTAAINRAKDESSEEG